MRRFAIALVALLCACGADPKSPAKQAILAITEKSIDTSEPFAIVRVNDDVDAFSKISDDQVPFGSGIALFNETVPLGLHHFGISHFARLVPLANEGQVDTISRFLHWADHALPLPPGDRFGFADAVNYDDTTKATTIIGLRTYVLTGAPIITHYDVAEAHVIEGDEDVPQIGIAIKLDEAGAKRLAEGTRGWPYRRLAIMTHGKIDLAPVVKAEIQGGAIELDVGARSDAILARAKKIEAELTAK
ncbi:MAG: hypothetical protein ABI183_22555 [Polyangiaceae bacterium]